MPDISTMTGQHATRAELLKRNPFLAKNRFTRAFAGAIVPGAMLSQSDWRTVRIALFGSPVLALIFGIEVFVGEFSHVRERLIYVGIALFFVLCSIVVSATSYGYFNRDRIDTTGGFKGNYNNIMRYALIGTAIGGSGIGVSALYDWLN